MVWWNQSLWSSVCGGKAVVFKTWTPCKAHIVALGLLTNWVLLFVNRYVGMPHGMSHWSMSTLLTCVAVVFNVGIDHDSFE